MITPACVKRKKNEIGPMVLETRTLKKSLMYDYNEDIQRTNFDLKICNHRQTIVTS